MAKNTKTEQAKAKAKTRSSKPLDLAKATVIDGASQAPRSVYEIVGFNPTSYYKAKDIEGYRKYLSGMAFWELQDHAQSIGVLPAATQKLTLERLEDKFIREHKRFILPNQLENTASPELQAQAAAIISRRR